jgi:hypothetical protein
MTSRRDEYWASDSSSSGDEEDAEEEDNVLTMMMMIHHATTTNVLLASTTTTTAESRRDPMFIRDRINWNLHVEQLLREGDTAFHRMYRMKHASFVKLCRYVDPFIRVDVEMSRRRSGGKGPITTEMMVHSLLRWLSGGSQIDVRISAGISHPSFYRIMYKCVDAILRVGELKYDFPTSEEEMDRATNNFSNHSTNNVMTGCVAALDGMLLRIQTPSSKETGNVKAYFSGHYQDYGINVQAACDSECRFVYACLAAPGGVNDIAAYRKTSLMKKIEELPIGRYVVGDNAYICTEHLLTPFAGEQKKESAVNDSFNFYLSQLRIRIEMTFGRFVNKWRIFRRPLQVNLKNVGKVFLCATRLHNFCINEKILSMQENDDQEEERSGKDPTDSDDDSSVDHQNDDGRRGPPRRARGGATMPPVDNGFIPSSVDVVAVRGNSMMRDVLLEKISSDALARPAHNIRRNRGRPQQEEEQEEEPNND